ncbi:TolB family protein [Mangrovivirga cuniculi]|uniref:WD40-like Beta Propeller Repeat n=1 Tax=Mangrovivirga cuniculi TaxID=2715131 RepID=A0A4D7K1M4_9BACT|nr:PD40 domain-containing protein [Mangrovivirga cuniculi]QCK13348.1 hypothetical protein DCC35_00575 [Mangrovivirga cuniculi]
MRFYSLLLITVLVCISCANPPFPEKHPQNYELFVTQRDTYAAVSPDGAKIAYYHSSGQIPEPIDYPSGLYVIDKDGNNRNLIIRGSILDPSWSPDGQWIVFSRLGAIQKIKLNGDSLTTLENPNSYGFFHPDWSPDGQNIYFDRADAIGDLSSIYKTDSDLNNATPILSGIGVGLRAPEISPDGQTLIGMKASHEFEGWQIFTVSFGEDSIEQQLTFNGDNRNPTWSKSGNEICWSKNVQIFIMDENGSNSKFLHYGISPDWLNANTIVFSFANGDYSKEVLYTIKTDGSEINQLTF